MSEKNEIINKIKEVIKIKIRPILVLDGGNIEFVDYIDNVLTVKLLGSCHGCPLSSITLKNTVKNLIKEVVPEIIDVVSIDFEEKDDTL